MFRSKVLLVATTNPGKLREVQSVFDGLALELQTLAQYPDFPPAVEDGDCFEENARRKAIHYASMAGVWTLADDSGLEVDALGGAPGVRSARFAGPGCDDRANNAKLIRALSGVPSERRTARFRCVLALAFGARVLATASGTFEGLIVAEPRGENGFGYDPHFYVPEHGLTVAEMSPGDKNRVSHRGQALRALRPRLEALLAGEIDQTADAGDGGS